MYKLLPVTAEDFPKLIEWIREDIDETHHAMVPEFWQTGADCFLNLKVADAEGDVFFVRFDREQDGLRMSTQFAPPTVVSKKRVTEAILGTLPAFIERVKQDGIQFIVFETTFPHLAGFMQINLRFRLVEGTNDYKLNFAVKPQAVPEQQECFIAHA
jgi:hypothetical protein